MSKSLFKAGGFNLQKFVTNAKHIQEIFDHEEGIIKTTQNIINSDETYSYQFNTWKTQISLVGEQKVLGMYAMESEL